MTGQAGLAVHHLDRHNPELKGYLTFARSWRADARTGNIYATRRVDDPRSHTHTSF